MAKWEGSELNKAKEILAYQLTELVHGEEEAKKAQEGARALFSGADTSHMPTTELSEEDFDEEGKIDLITLLVKAELVPSRSEGRRAIQQVVYPSMVRSSPIFTIRLRRMLLQGTGSSETRQEKIQKNLCKIISHICDISWIKLRHSGNADR